MKPIDLEIKNIGLIEHVKLPLNKSLTILFGEIKNGKTTIAKTSVNLLRGGPFPKDILRHGTNDGFVHMNIVGGSIRREFYRDPKDGEVKAHEIVYLRDNNPVPVKRPVEQLRKLFGNPFLQDGDYLKNMGPAERQRYFVDLLGVDTGELDAEKKDLDVQRRMLEAKIAGYGEIELEPVLPIDAGPIKKEIVNRRIQHGENLTQWQTELDGLRLEWQSGKRFELQQAKNALEITENEWRATCETAERLERELNEARQKVNLLLTQRAGLLEKTNALVVEVSQLPDLTERANGLKAKIATPLELTDLNDQLTAAATQDVRVAAYQERLVKAEQRKNDNDLLGTVTERFKEIKQLKAQKLAQIAQDSGIKGLGFDEEGNFTYENTANEMISGAQHVMLGQELAGLYPESIGLEVVDGAERLGKSVYSLIDGAKARGSTILATVVSDKPAEAHDEIGIYFVRDGKFVQ